MKCKAPSQPKASEILHAAMRSFISTSIGFPRYNIRDPFRPNHPMARPRSCHLKPSFTHRPSDINKRFRAWRTTRPPTCLETDDLTLRLGFRRKSFPKEPFWISRSFSIAWCVCVTGRPFGFEGSRKIGLPPAPIGIFGVRPTTRYRGAKPSYCCTCEFKCDILSAP